MLTVLSPAKSLDFESKLATRRHTEPRLLGESGALIDVMRTKTPADIARLMHISDDLAHLNATRYAEYDAEHTLRNARQAILAFNGDVYLGMEARTFDARDLTEAQKSIRILSGLYGLLRPLDLIQPYRLEMGIRLANPGGKDLYAFWGERIVDALNAALTETGASALVNLASEEYFKSVRVKKLAAPVIQPVFEDWSGGRYKVVSFFAKRARGLMARHVLVKRLKKVEGLKKFAEEGYAFDKEASDAVRWVFRRKSDQAE